MPSRNQYLSVSLSVFTMVFFLSFSVYAADKQWSGAGDASSWSDASNWYPSGVPSSSDDVSIDAIGTSVNAQALATFYAKSLTVGGTNESNFTTDNFVYGTVAPAKNTDNALYIRKNGAVTLKGVGDITLKGAFKNSEESQTSEPSFMFGAE